MTMLAHTLKDILQLIPEVQPLIKEASIDKELPLDNKDSCIATALQQQYFEKVAYRPTDIFALDKIAQAIELYGVKDIVADLSEKMVKAAQVAKYEKEQNSTETFMLKVASFEGDLCTVTDVKARSQAANSLYKEAMDRSVKPSESVVLYSGNAFLDKEAAARSLSVRHSMSGNEEFTKLASAIANTPDSDFTPELKVRLADTICGLDKSAGLAFKGFNFYKEAFFHKEASISISLCGKPVPYESFERLGKARIAQYIGPDVAKEMDGGPMNFKQVVETLPVDLQKIMSNLLKNV